MLMIKKLSWEYSQLVQLAFLTDGAPSFPAGAISSPQSKVKQVGHLREGCWTPTVV